MIDRIVVVGAGQTTQSMVGRLARLAPITVIDRSSRALTELVVSPGAPAVEHAARNKRPSPLAAEPFSVTRVEGDGASRLVLEDVRSDHATALVVITGSDRQNLEVCRLGGELGFSPVVAVVIDPATAADYAALGARPIVRATLLGDMVERALRFDGIAIATSVGLGEGDLVEIRILASSPAIGQRLSDLHPDGWRVAAIYRGGELVIPTGGTRIEVDDRVLLVGAPTILRHVAENLRVGVPDFPLRFGSSVVVYLPRGRDRALEAPAEVMTLQTRATRLVRMAPGSQPSKTEITHTESPESLEVRPPKYVEDQPLAGKLFEEHVRSILALHPGVIVARSRRRGSLASLFGIGGPDRRLCDLTSVPVLFPGTGAHLARIVLLLDQATKDLRTIDSAIDLARMLELPLALLRVEMPSYMAAASGGDEVARSFERRAGLYSLRAVIERRVGNPIAETLRFVDTSDLCVVARGRGGRDSFTSPDVALRIARAGRCSTLVFTESDAR